MTGNVTLNPITITATPGQQLFFSVYADTDLDPSSYVSFDPSVNGQDAGSYVNIFYRDPTFDATDSAGQLIDPMSGGFHRWFTGDWNGSLAFDPTQITFANTTGTGAAYGFAYPNRQGTTAVPQPIWVGRGVDSYVAAGQLKPSQKGGNSAMAGAGLQDLRTGDTWNGQVQVSLGVTGTAVLGDTSSDINFVDMNGDRLPDSVATDGIRYNTGNGFTAPVAVSGIANYNGTLRKTLHRSVSLTVGGIGDSLISDTDSEGKPHKFLHQLQCRHQLRAFARELGFGGYQRGRPAGRNL